jgi:hypothetical protein
MQIPHSKLGDFLIICYEVKETNVHCIVIEKNEVNGVKMLRFKDWLCKMNGFMTVNKLARVLFEAFFQNVGLLMHFFLPLKVFLYIANKNT